MTTTTGKPDSPTRLSKLVILVVRYMIENRIGVCEVLSKHYQRLVRKNLPVYLAPEGELTNYVMTKEEWRHVSPEVKQKVC